MKSENNMNEYIYIWVVLVLGFSVFAMFYVGSGKYRQYRQANICQEYGTLYGLKAKTIENYSWSNTNDCYLGYKDRWVHPWYMDMINTRDFR
jgi:hypothetical protein